MPKKSSISEILRETRLRSGFTQDDLAAKAGVSRRTIQDIERGINNPQVQSLEALAGALGIPIVEFFDLANGGKMPAEYLSAKGALPTLKQTIESKQNQNAAGAGRMSKTVTHTYLTPSPSPKPGDPTLDEVVAILQAYGKAGPDSQRKVRIQLGLEEEASTKTVLDRAKARTHPEESPKPKSNK